MLDVVRMLLGKLDGFRYDNDVNRALALHQRGEVRRDGLEPVNVTTQLQIDWRARDIHPWDRGLLSPTQRATAFVEQSLADTEAVINRLFEALPQVDSIALKVLDWDSENVILSGIVERPASAPDLSLSVGMRLRYLGVTYHSAGSQFEVLEPDNSVPAADSGPIPMFPRTEPLTNAMFRRDVKP
jgi:hypothetical protein